MAGFLVFCDFLYLWIIISVVSVVWMPCLAGPLEDNQFEDETSLSDLGSGHDEILEILGLADDEDGRGSLDELDRLEDDGDGIESALSKTVKEKFNLRMDELKVTCYHCLGDGVKGCDVVSMLRDVESYSVSCIGKCLNVSSGTTSVYDCAHEMTSRVNTCFKNGATEMCFCSGSYCNGPVLTPRRFGHYKTPFLFPHLLGLDENQTTRQENETTILLGDTTTETDSWSKGDNQGIFDNLNDSRVIQSSNDTKYRNEEVGLDNTFSSQEQELSLDDFEGRKKLPYARKTEIDIIIPRSNWENFTDSTETSPEPVDINELSVGNLQDGTIDADSPENKANGFFCSSILISVVSMCLLFSFLHML